MAWTNERIEQLKRLWEAGNTASQIAEELGGVSRNAVIGKAHRLGLQSRPSPVRGNDSPASETVRPAAPKAASEPAATASPAPPPPAPKAAPTPPAAPAPVAKIASQPPAPTAPTHTVFRSIGPGGFQRQAPGEQQAPSTPAPPRRLVPAKPSAEIADKTSLLDLNDKICKWPLGHPGEPDFHFCGAPVNPGFPYCLEHCSVAYQAQLPRRDRRPPPPLPYGGPRVR
jgi:GcrA cell cycle regulator